MRFVQFLFFKHALVHRFVNNCIIHAGYGFECAVQKT